MQPTTDMHPLPIVPATRRSERNQGDKQRQIVGIARELNQIGWGNQGSITGMVEDLPIDQIWPNPMRVITHSAEAIADMKESLQVDGQKDPIVVAYAQAPADLEGYEECTLIIVDGDLRYRGRLKQGKDTVRGIVQPFTSMTQIMMDSAIRTLHRHSPTPLEVGRFIIRIRLAYDMEADRNPNVPKFPTQDELGRMLGRHQSTINQWLKLAAQPAEIVNLIDAGQLSQAQSMEVIRITDEPARLRRAMQIVQQNALEPVKRDAIRNDTRARQRPLALTDNPVRYDDLWSPRIVASTSTPLAMAYTLHDLAHMLVQVMQGNETPHPALLKLEKALLDPAIQAFLQTILA